MTSRYGGITGTEEIASDWNNINIAFENVQSDMDKNAANITANKTSIDNHIASSSAHPAQNITFSGSIPGANVKEAIDNTNERIDNLIITGGDSSPEVADARGGYPVLGARLNASDDRMAANLQLMQNLFVASWHGVDESIGTADATVALNGLFAAAKAEGKRYVYFDVPHTYNVTGDLTNARDLILIGCGARIKSTNLKNYFIQICDSLASYNGRFNSYPETDLLFKTAAAALQSKSVNVTIWGDSISTGGSDVIGIKYGSNNTGSTQISSQGLTPGDSYYLRLIDLLTAKFPDVTFNFYNRAIGGMLIQNSEDNQTFNGVTKPWPEHIRDTNPDILIIGFGMNTNLFLCKTYRFCMDRILNYIDTNYTKKPSVCWVTTPRPTMALEADMWGSYDSQLSRHLAAYTTRLVGKKRGGYIIDVNKVSDIKRTGVDYSSTILQAVNATDIISGTYTESGGVYTFDADGEIMNLSTCSTDFTLEFDLSVSGAVAGDGNLWLGYNLVDSYESVIQFKPDLAGAGWVQSYANFLDAANYSTAVNYTDSVSWNDGVFRNIRIEKRADTLNIFVNGVRVIRDITIMNNLPGAIRMFLSGTGPAVYKLRNIKLYEGKYQQYTPGLLESEMWGSFADGEYSTKTPWGGNGVNHPTTIGLEKAFMPVLREFVDDLASIVRSSSSSLKYVPLQRTITSWGTAAITNTTSGAELRYVNVPKTDLLNLVALAKADGTRISLRKDITTYDDVIKLNDGEFAVYSDPAYTYIFIAYTGSLSASYTFTAYYSA